MTCIGQRRREPISNGSVTMGNQDNFVLHHL
jgi:hypothetical protein